jgi:class 3 adenylate cyclase
MSWDYEKSLGRIQKHLDGLGEIEIEDLVREADLNSLLSETKCRGVVGAHVYTYVANFPQMATAYADDEAEYKRFLQAVHLFQREVSRIVEDVDKFNGLRIQFQGPKLHALFYRPIKDTRQLAILALFLQLVLKDFTNKVFNSAFPFSDDFTIAGGADVGYAIGTRNGRNGDRELLFLGPCANYAAKIISSAGRLRITTELYDVLPENLQEICTKINDDVYQVNALTQTRLDELLSEYKIKWDREASTERIAEDKRAFPLKDIEYSSANALIDIDALSIRNNKKVMAASIFGDVSGFTAYIDGAETDEKKREALRVLHAIRREMATVVTKDHGGIRVQYQGDRVQGIFHMPKDDDERIATDAVEAAISLQSSMEKTLKQKLPEAAALRLAVGVDLDTTLVSKLGTRAHRDRICLGEPVEKAAANEENCTGGKIGISKRVYDLLPERLSKHFGYETGSSCYVAGDLTWDKVELAARAAAYGGGAPVFVRSTKSGVEITREEVRGARSVTPASSWASEDET